MPAAAAAVAVHAAAVAGNATAASSKSGDKTAVIAEAWVSCSEMQRRRGKEGDGIGHVKLNGRAVEGTDKEYETILLLLPPPPVTAGSRVQVTVVKSLLVCPGCRRHRSVSMPQ